MDRGAWWATAWGRKESDIIELHTHTHIHTHTHTHTLSILDPIYISLFILDVYQVVHIGSRYMQYYLLLYFLDTSNTFYCNNGLN